MAAKPRRERREWVGRQAGRRGERPADLGGRAEQREQLAVFAGLAQLDHRGRVGQRRIAALRVSADSARAGAAATSARNASRTAMRLARDMAFPSRLRFAFPFPIPPMGILSSARPGARHPRVACDDRGEANIGLAPVLCLGAGVRPSSAFVPSPRNEGSDAPRGRVVRITPDGPDDHSGRTRIAGSWRISGCAAPTRRASGISRFRVHGQSDRPAVSSAAGRLPECRPGT